VKIVGESIKERKEGNEEKKFGWVGWREGQWRLYKEDDFSFFYFLGFFFKHFFNDDYTHSP